MIVIRVNNVKEAARKIESVKQRYNQKPGRQAKVKNIYFDAHGPYWEEGGSNPYVRVGREQVGGKNLAKKLAPLRKALDEGSVVVFLGCNVAGGDAKGSYLIGEYLLDELADALKHPVIANKSWTPSGDIFNTEMHDSVSADFDSLGSQVSDMLEILSGEAGKVQVSDFSVNQENAADYKERPSAFEYIGYWAVAVPGKGMNVKQINALVLLPNGNFRISETDHNAEKRMNINLLRAYSKLID